MALWLIIFVIEELQKKKSSIHKKTFLKIPADFSKKDAFRVCNNKM
jgi:hypothetical protein